MGGEGLRIAFRGHRRITLASIMHPGDLLRRFDADVSKGLGLALQRKILAGYAAVHTTLDWLALRVFRARVMPRLNSREAKAHAVTAMCCAARPGAAATCN